MQADVAIAHVAANTLVEPMEMQRRDFGTGSSYDFAAIRSDQVSGTRYFQQWPLIRLRVAQAQRVADGAGVTVAVVDTGVDLNHPALAERLVAGYDFVEGDAEPDDSANGLDDDQDGVVDEGAGHGTHVAGIVTLVAPQARLMPVRVLDSEGVGSYFDIVAGIVYAAEHGAQVINLSLGGTHDAAFLHAAVEYALGKGALVVAAAGAYQVDYPARYAGVISVGATTMRGQPAEFSDFDEGQVTVYAPGVSIYSTYFDGGYAWWTGTSMATAFVAGEAALLRSVAGCEQACAAAAIAEQSRPVVPTPDADRRVDVFSALRAAIRE